MLRARFFLGAAFLGDGDGDGALSDELATSPSAMSSFPSVRAMVLLLWRGGRGEGGGSRVRSACLVWCHARRHRRKQTRRARATHPCRLACARA